MTDFKRIVVKIGSNVLTRADGSPHFTRLSSLVDQVAELHRAGHEVILVSSGAVACGRSEVSLPQGVKPGSVAARQLLSAVGQVRLINHYHTLFREYGITVGQVLATKEDFATRTGYLNQKQCIGVMLESRVLPIVNENDTTSITELMFTDNDELSGMMAGMVDADALIILSNVDGIYTGPPDAPGSTLIARIEPHTPLGEHISGQRSGFGRGGMLTKAGIARRVAAEGIACLLYTSPSPRD